MTPDELRELVKEMRELEVTELQFNGTTIKLGPKPAPPKERDPDKPEYTVGNVDFNHQKSLEMLFKHSSKKPFIKKPTP